MLKNKPSIRHIFIKNGLFTFAGLAAFFLLIKTLGLIHVVELRCLNFPIMVTGIWMAIRGYKKSRNEAPAPVNTLALGIRTTVVAMIPFALFIFIYLRFDPVLLEYIRSKVLFGYHLNARLLTLLVTCEGLLSGFFISYTLMQPAKRIQWTVDS